MCVRALQRSEGDCGLETRQPFPSLPSHNQEAAIAVGCERDSHVPRKPSGMSDLLYGDPCFTGEHWCPACCVFWGPPHTLEQSLFECPGLWFLAL